MTTTDTAATVTLHRVNAGPTHARRWVWGFYNFTARTSGTGYATKAAALAAASR